MRKYNVDKQLISDIINTSPSLIIDNMSIILKYYDAYIKKINQYIFETCGIKDMVSYNMHRGIQDKTGRILYNWDYSRCLAYQLSVIQNIYDNRQELVKSVEDTNNNVIAYKKKLKAFLNEIKRMYIFSDRSKVSYTIHIKDVFNTSDNNFIVIKYKDMTCIYHLSNVSIATNTLAYTVMTDIKSEIKKTWVYTIFKRLFMSEEVDENDIDRFIHLCNKNSIFFRPDNYTGTDGTLAATINIQDIGEVLNKSKYVSQEQKDCYNAMLMLKELKI